MSDVVTLPTLAPVGTNGVVSLAFQNAGAGLLEGGTTTFGQVFVAGDLPAGTTLMALVNGVQVPVQMDVTSRYDDGSVKMAVLSVERPDIAAGQSLDVVLVRATGTTAPAPVVDLAAISAAHSFVVDLAIEGRAPMQIDVLAALRQAIADGSADFWQKGALATQARVEIPIDASSMRLVFDVTAFRDGGLSVDALFNNDRAMEAIGGRVNYTTVVRMDGREVTRETVSQGQYQNWHREFSSDGTDGGQGLGTPTDGWLNIRHDIAYLQKSGAIARYDLSIGAYETRLEGYATKIATDAMWGEPLYNYDVLQAMGSVGTRSDIGFVTGNIAAWLQTQDARAAAYVMGQAHAAGSAPWNLWDAANDTWLNTDNYPKLWSDYRGGTGTPGDPNSTGLTQQIPGDTGWGLADSHQPNLSFVPYIMTGERWILDNVNAQASWSVMTKWPDPSRLADGTDQIVDFIQVRSAAWSMREVEGAAWINPDGSAEQAYFGSVSNENWKYIISKIPEWTAMQGEAHGWLPGLYQARLTPWQQDFFAHMTIVAAARGNEDAMTVLKWTSNFLIGRFTNEANGFESRDGAGYQLRVADDAGNWLKTWAEIGATSTEWGWTNGNDTWENSNGYYPQLALATLAGIYMLTGNEAAKTAYLNLLAERPPYTTLADYQGESTHGIAIPGVLANPPPQIFPASLVPHPPADFVGHADGVALTIRLSADVWNGNPWAAVSVDGYEMFRGQVSALRGTGTNDILLGMVDPDRVYNVSVRFLNDATDYSLANDRNLYVEDILVGGVSTKSFRGMWGTGVWSFNVAVGDVTAPEGPGIPTIGAGADVVRIGISGNAWKGYPLYVVLVNGVQVGDVREAYAQRSLGQVEYIDVRGDFGVTGQTVSVRFLNDAWGGSSALDRNLWVESVSFNGTNLNRVATLGSSGATATFQVGSGVAPATTPETLPDYVVTPPPTTTPTTPPADTLPEPTTPPTVIGDALSVGSGPSVVRVGLSGDAYNGNARATILIDGVVVATDVDVVAARARNEVQYVDVRGTFNAATHAVVVRFANDLWGGTADTDRNLYLLSISVNGASIGASAALYSNRDVRFEFAPATLPPPSTLGTGTVNADTLIGDANANELRGLDGNDSLSGGDGADTLDGGAGADTMSGGAGNDVYVVESTGDRVVEAANGGIDTVVSFISATLPNEVENLVLAGTSVIHGTGNALANVIMGNAAANRLSGLGGADTIYGGEGADTLDGGTEADRMEGGDGNDVYIVDHADDVVVETSIGGIDTVNASVTFSMADNIENLVLTGTAAINGWGNALDNRITGNAAANRITGGPGDDTLEGGGGNDTLEGGGGNDVYYADAGDTLYEASNAGTDTVFVASTWTLGADFERLILTGTAAVNGTGNTLGNRIIGNDAGNWLSGLAGNDTLDGGAGADTLVGGTGDDTFIVDHAGDVAMEAAGEGMDVVLSGVTFTLGTGIENLTLTGDLATNGFGNDLDNRIIGNGAANRLVGGIGADTLNGGAGADTMDGGAGDDLYVVDDTGDRIIEVGGAGIDTVRSTVTFALANNVDNLQLMGTAQILGIGNRQNNTITGNSASNALAGLDGNDILNGMEGNDYVEGGAGRDRLLGGDGADRLVGGLGADTMTGGAGADSFEFGGPADGGDRVTDFVKGEDVLVVSASGFGGGLTPGALPSARFAMGIATDATPQFVYQANGVLLWDADGIGGGAAVTVAIFQGRPALAASDIMVIG
jgi:Ca2+-binding RTX toxin-like protein